MSNNRDGMTVIVRTWCRGSQQDCFPVQDDLEPLVKKYKMNSFYCGDPWGMYDDRISFRKISEYHFTVSSNTNIKTIRKFRDEAVELLNSYVDMVQVLVVVE